MNPMIGRAAIMNSTHRRIIRYGNAPCGAGKTFALANRAAQMAKDGQNVLLIQPTVNLIEKTKVEEFGRMSDWLRVHVFHNASVGDNVAKKLSDYLADPEDTSQVVLATHQALPLLPFIPEGSWHILIDETLQVDREYSHVIPITHPILTDHVRIAQHDGIYGRIEIDNIKEIRHLAANTEEDELLETFREIASILSNPHWQSFVNLEHFNRLKDGGGEGRLTIHSLQRPSVLSSFASAFIAAANFEDSGMFHLWSRDIEFVPDETFSESLRFRSHQNANTTTVHYALQKNWSRSLLEKEADGISNLERMRDAAKAVIRSDRFVWQANKSVPNNFFAGGDRLPNNPLGLNGYSNVNNIVFLSALNASPAHFRFLIAQGLSPGEIERQGYCNIGYQAIMRTSLRDPNNHEPKNIIVPDERMAEFLGEMLPGSELKRLDSGISEEVRQGGRPRVYENNAEKFKQRRKDEREKRVDLLNQLHFSNLAGDSASPGGASESSDLVRIDSCLSRRTPYSASIYSHIKSTTPLGYLFCADQNAFVLGMKELHAKIYESKDCIPLFSPAVFDPDQNGGGKGTRRGGQNILYVQNIVLDFEGGDLQPTELAALFPDLRLIVTNSFRHTSDAPRFRVIVLTTERLTKEVYEALFDALAIKLEAAGFVRRTPRPRSALKRSGLDYSKRSAASLFHFPSQAEIASDSFFIFYEEGRQPLVPTTWIQNMPIKLINEHPVAKHHGGQGPVDTAEVKAAIERWRLTGPGEGNQCFYRLALDFKRLGMDKIRLEAALASEAKFARSPAERAAQIPSILKSLFGIE